MYTCYSSNSEFGAASSERGGIVAIWYTTSAQIPGLALELLCVYVCILRK